MVDISALDQFVGTDIGRDKARRVVGTVLQVVAGRVLVYGIAVC